MTKEKMADDITLYNIASVKSYNYCEEYNPSSGQTQMKDGYRYLKQGYIDGFLAGIAHRLTGGNDD
jgi:hypothetical protein